MWPRIDIAAAVLYFRGLLLRFQLSPFSLPSTSTYWSPPSVSARAVAPPFACSAFALRIAFLL
jgi:hypothetical protein